MAERQGERKIDRERERDGKRELLRLRTVISQSLEKKYLKVYICSEYSVSGLLD